jgi:hypothetical protein
VNRAENKKDEPSGYRRQCPSLGVDGFGGFRGLFFCFLFFASYPIAVREIIKGLFPLGGIPLGMGVRGRKEIQEYFPFFLSSGIPEEKGGGISFPFSFLSSIPPYFPPSSMSLVSVFSFKIPLSNRN